MSEVEASGSSDAPVGTETVPLRIVLVTGANKGIGFAIAHHIATNPDLAGYNFHVIVGARDEKAAASAVASLKEAGAVEVSHTIIDVTDDKSVAAAAEDIKTRFGGLDVLINNAGMAFKGSAFDENVARTTIGTNYFGTLRVCHAMFPLLRPYSRVVNVSSMVSSSSLKKMSSEIRGRFMSEELTEGALSDLMNEFISDVREGQSDQKGWPHTTYGVSKVGVSMLTRIQARDNKLEGCLINACCPGWVRTDMAGPNATRSPEEGALTPVAIATLPFDSTTTGTMWENSQQSDWIVGQ